ncbi:MAG TPA: M23 family metallopeptidase [Longimicrobiales bacterium]|nr:M23 family metallopeptidase [Longimicrobiales bacterium]
MARREWTVVIVSDDEAELRQFRLSREAMRITIAVSLFLFAGLTSLATAMLVGIGAGRADDQLVQKNELLTQELSRLGLQVDTLQMSLDSLSRQDEFYRLLAGLDPMDSDILLAGIGGPDADSVESHVLYRVDPRTGRQAHSTGSQINSLIRRASVLAFSWREAQDTLSEKHARLGAMPSIYPTRGYVSSAFTTSRWHPVLNRARPHEGIDIVAPTGTPVVATAHGRVNSVGHRGEYGLMIEIDHGYGLVTRYAHLSRTSVKVGEMVARGDTIGNVGQSGLATGPHLHYEVLEHGRPANPRRYILENSVLAN